MPSDDLAARLRALRRSDAATKVAKPAHIAKPQPAASSAGVRSKVVKRDDVDELIARMRDEVDVARGQGELLDEGETSRFAGDGQLQAPLQLDVAAEGKTFRSMAQEASSDAAAALREHRKTIEQGQEKVARPPSGADKRLTLEAKARPVLVRPTSSYQGEASDGQEDDAIASELADAMGDIGGESSAARSGSVATSPSPQPLPQQPQPLVAQPQSPPDEAAAAPAQPKAQEDYEDDIENEVQDLLARFSALRPSASRSVSAASTNSTVPQSAARPADDDADDGDDGDDVEDRFAGLSLPSAPSTALQSPPAATEPQAPAHPTLGPSHSDIPSDRDLSPFHRLVSKEFNVSSRLSNPTAHSDGPLFPSAPRSGLDEEEGDEIFCSLCSEDASLTCSCPGEGNEYEGCAGDAYCSGCWVEAHSGMGREELREHRTKDVTVGRRRRGGGQGKGTRRRAMAA